MNCPHCKSLNTQGKAEGWGCSDCGTWWDIDKDNNIIWIDVYAGCTHKQTIQIDMKGTRFVDEQFDGFHPSYKTIFTEKARLRTGNVMLIENDDGVYIHFHDLPKLYNCRIIGGTGKEGRVVSIEINERNKMKNGLPSLLVSLKYEWEDGTTSENYWDDFIEWICVGGPRVKIL